MAHASLANQWAADIASRFRKMNYTNDIYIRWIWRFGNIVWLLVAFSGLMLFTDNLTKSSAPITFWSQQPDGCTVRGNEQSGVDCNDFTHHSWNTCIIVNVALLNNNKKNIHIKLSQVGAKHIFRGHKLFQICLWRRLVEMRKAHATYAMTVWSD